MNSIDKKSAKWMWQNCEWWEVTYYDEKRNVIYFQFGNYTTQKIVSKSYCAKLTGVSIG